MTFRRENDQRYASFWRSLGNFLRNNSGFPVGGVARSGSRRRGDYRPNSDLDVIYWIAGNPPKTQVYPELVRKLNNVMNVDASIGGSYNVINIKKDVLDVDLVLLPEWEFTDEVRRYNLEEI